MKSSVKAAAARAGRVWINWTSFKLGVLAGAVGGMLIMAVAMAGLRNGEHAQRVAEAVALRIGQ